MCKKHSVSLPTGFSQFTLHLLQALRSQRARWRYRWEGEGGQNLSVQQSEHVDQSKTQATASWNDRDTIDESDSSSETLPGLDSFSSFSPNSSPLSLSFSAEWEAESPPSTLHSVQTNNPCRRTDTLTKQDAVKRDVAGRNIEEKRDTDCTCTEEMQQVKEIKSRKHEEKGHENRIKNEDGDSDKKKRQPSVPQNLSPTHPAPTFLLTPTSISTISPGHTSAETNNKSFLLSLSLSHPSVRHKIEELWVRSIYLSQCLFSTCLF